MSHEAHGYTLASTGMERPLPLQSFQSTQLFPEAQGVHLRDKQASTFLSLTWDTQDLESVIS